MKNTLVSIAIPLKKDHANYWMWMQVRQENGPLNGFLEFPGGKIEDGESPQEAIKRELSEEIGLDVQLGELKLFKILQHQYSDRKVTLYIHIFNFNNLSPIQKIDDKNWFNLTGPNDIEDLLNKTLEANRGLMLELRNYFKQQMVDDSDKYLWQ